MQAERLAMTCHQSRIATAGVSTFGATALAFNRMLGGCAPGATLNTRSRAMNDKLEYPVNGATGRDVITGWIVYAAVLFSLVLFAVV